MCLNKAGIICSNSKVFAGCNNVVELAKTTDIPAQYVHPQEKQCTWNPEITIIPKIYYTQSFEVNRAVDVSSYGINQNLGSVDNQSQTLVRALWYVELVCNIGGAFTSVSSWPNSRELCIRITLGGYNAEDYTLNVASSGVLSPRVGTTFNCVGTGKSGYAIGEYFIGNYNYSADSRLSIALWSDRLSSTAHICAMNISGTIVVNLYSLY